VALRQWAGIWLWAAPGMPVACLDHLAYWALACLALACQAPAAGLVQQMKTGTDPESMVFMIL